MKISVLLVTLALVLGFAGAGSLPSAEQPQKQKGWIETLSSWWTSDSPSETAAAKSPKSLTAAHGHVNMANKGVALVSHGYPIVTMCPLNVMFILDGSDSVSPQGFNLARQYLKESIALVTSSYTDADVGVIMFSAGIAREIQLRARNPSELQQLYRDIDGLVQPRLETDLHLALQRAHEVLSINSANEGKIIVLISDGCPNNVQQTKAEAEAAWSKGVYIMSIAIEKAQIEMLKQLSYRIQDIRTPIDWKYTVACPPATLPRLPGGLCSDIMIVMDGSDSASKHQSVIKQYLANLADRFINVQNKMGLVLYGTNIDASIALTPNKAILSQAILSNLDFPATGTGTAQGIREAERHLASSQSPVMIIITDGPPLDSGAAASAAQQAIRNGIQVLVIGVGSHANYDQLVSVAGGITRNVFPVNSFLDLYSVDFTSNVCGNTRQCPTSFSCINGNIAMFGDACSCQCNAGFTGIDCSSPIGRNCDICGNGGRRLNPTSITDCRCECAPGFIGNTCEQDMCRNIIGNCAGTVTRGRGTCSCTCNPGFTGSDCRDTICAQNQFCDDPSQGIVTYDIRNRRCGCICTSGYTGQRCEFIDCNFNSKCQNGGTAQRSGTTCFCACPTGYEGTFCERPIVICSPCLNGGTQSSSTNDCSCSCRNGFSGLQCQIDECQRIRATCEFGIPVGIGGGCRCQCFSGITGTNCDTCAMSCQNGGNAYINPVTQSCACNCPSGFSGINCQFSPRCLNTNCNGGTSLFNGDQCTCICLPGFTGETCRNPICSNFADCNNRGITYFNQTSNECGCNCNTGYLQPTCRDRDCSNLQCGSGTIRSINNVCTCQCPPTFTGTNCQTPICQSCLNGGTRISSTSCDCRCLAGYSGLRCENDLCSTVACRFGNLVRQPGRCSCQCNPGYTGPACDTRICSACLNGGTQSSSTNDCSCSCRNGFSGSQCQIDLCSAVACRFGNLVRQPGRCSCQCNPGYTGPACDTNLCTDAGCNFRGTPFYDLSSGTCRCANCQTGWTGNNCETRDCPAQIDCNNGGTAALGTSGCYCRCPSGFQGINCETLVCNAITYSCSNGGTPYTNTGNTCSCTCPNGFTGPACGRALCDGFCNNGGIPTPTATGCACRCTVDYTGPQCSTPICSPSDCNNRGDSVFNPATGGCQCFCFQSFNGQSCENIIPCRDDCLNGGEGRMAAPGVCVCQCPPGYTGVRCETFMDAEECTGADNQCQNGQPAIRNSCTGQCQCVCSQQYAGAFCELQIEADVCDECYWQNGVGYTHVKGRCDMYVTCQRLDNGNFLTIARDCAPGTFWDNEKLTCRAVGDVKNCPQDPCRNMAPYGNYSHGSQCQEFYTCGADGNTEGKQCCDLGWAFNSNQRRCVPDATCIGTCKRAALDLRSSACYKGCVWATNSSDSQQFFRKLNPRDHLTCGPGTIFNDTICACDYDRRPIERSDVCEPDRYLHFDGVYQPEFTYHNVTLTPPNTQLGITTGAGNFNGDDRVLIQRFANSGFHFKYFIVMVRVCQPQVSPGQEVAVISNGDCGINESISITFTSGQVHFKVQPEGSSPSVLSVSLTAGSIRNGCVELELHYIKNNNGRYTFFGKVDGISTASVSLNAVIEDRKCALQVGHGFGYSNLIAYVDWVRIYTVCDPNDPITG